jgi:hypothetical protein
MYPTKEEWTKSTSDLLAEREEQVATYRRNGSKIPERLLEVVVEIRDTIEQRSKWAERDFDIWRNAPVNGEVGYEEYVRDYPHLQPLWEEETPATAINYTAMLRKAGMTAETNLIDGVVAIDAFFGKGFATEHPEIIAAFMHAAGTVYAGEIVARQIGVGFDGVAEALHAANLNDNLGAIAEKLRDGALRELVEATQNLGTTVDIISKQMLGPYD